MPGESIPFRVIAGLGNPGPEYAATRHNAGFWFVDEVARRLGASFSLDKRMKAELAAVTLHGRKLHLVKPMSFMNNSGEGLSALLRFYKLPIEHLLIAHDELDLQPGFVRLKRGGGHGGHNGLRDAVARLGGNAFWRLRIGIGHPGDSRQVSGYVLKRAPADEERLIEDAIALALSEIDEILDGDINAATKVLNSHRPDRKPA